MANQLNKQLTIETPPNPLQQPQQQRTPLLPPPLPAQPPSSEASNNNENWANFSQMNTPQTTVFATPPQSLPVTPNPVVAAAPPPVLPSLPVSQTYQTPAMLHQPGLIAQPAMNMFMMQQPQQALPQLYQTNIYATPQQHYATAMMASPPSSTSATTAPGGVETFEQKWDRIQAAKHKTNPFAEDIAKKYEIKL
jgi:hypothetical protein